MGARRMASRDAQVQSVSLKKRLQRVLDLRI